MKKAIITGVTTLFLCVGCSLNVPPAESQMNRSNEINVAQNEKASIFDNEIDNVQTIINEEGYIELKFKNTFSNDYLRSISGKKVTMTGYISTLSPINGEFAYLMNLPYQSCPYCIPGTSEIYNTIAIYPKKNGKIEFTEKPVTIEGILETGTFTDAFGYTYNVRIKDVITKNVDVDKLSENVLIYNAISQEGIVKDIDNAFIELDKIVFYDYYQQQFGMTLDSIEIFDTDIINTIISKLKAINENDYSDLIGTLKKTITISDKANKNVEEKKYDENKKLQDELNEVFREFGVWMTKYEM